MNTSEILQFDRVGIDSALTTIIKYVIDFGLQLFVAILILGVGMWLANKFTRSLKRVMELRKLDPSLQSFLGSFVSILSKIFVFVIVLTTVGVQMTSIVAVLGAASLAVGMSLQGTLQNFAGGIVILLFKPFKVGDTIIIPDGQTGIVKKIMIFTTEIQTFDNQVVIIPNANLSNGIITNMSRGGSRRTDLTIGISYGDSVDKARSVIMDILAADKRVLSKPAEPAVFVSDLADSAVVLTVRFWTSFADMYAVAADIREQIYETLPKKKLSFPFPQMDVHVIK